MDSQTYDSLMVAERHNFPAIEGHEGTELAPPYFLYTGLETGGYWSVEDDEGACVVSLVSYQTSCES